jgi:hypothetical protein
VPVYVQEHEVVPVLTTMRLPRDILTDLLDRAVGERANVTASDPSGTAGTEMRRWVTRFLRDAPELRALGWVPCSHNQIAGIRNDELKIKIAFMNTDARTGMLSQQPHSVAERGGISEQLINQNYGRGTASLFGDDDRKDIDPIADYDFWYFCAFVSDRHIAAELSRPVGCTAGIVDQYSHRIILWQPGEKGGMRRDDPIPEDFAPLSLPDIKRLAY